MYARVCINKIRCAMDTCWHVLSTWADSINRFRIAVWVSMGFCLIKWPGV